MNSCLYCGNTFTPQTNTDTPICPHCGCNPFDTVRNLSDYPDTYLYSYATKDTLKLDILEYLVEKKNVAASLRMGAYLIEKKQYEEAIPYLQTVIAHCDTSSPDSIKANCLLAAAHYAISENQWGAAKACYYFENAKEQYSDYHCDPLSYEPLSTYMITCRSVHKHIEEKYQVELKEYRKREIHFQELSNKFNLPRIDILIEIPSPENLNSCMECGKQLLQDKKYDAAKVYFEHVRETNYADGTYWYAHTLLAENPSTIDEYDKIIAYLNEAIAQKCNDLQLCQKDLATAIEKKKHRVELEEYRKREAHFQKLSNEFDLPRIDILAAIPSSENIKACIECGKQLLQNRKYDAAKVYFEHVCETNYADGAYWYAHTLLAENPSTVDECDKVIKYLEEAIARKCNHIQLCREDLSTARNRIIELLDRSIEERKWRIKMAEESARAQETPTVPYYVLEQEQRARFDFDGNSTYDSAYDSSGLTKDEIIHALDTMMGVDVTGM